MAAALTGVKTWQCNIWHGFLTNGDHVPCRFLCLFSAVLRATTTMDATAFRRIVMRMNEWRDHVIPVAPRALRIPGGCDNHEAQEVARSPREAMPL
jgi:hypothetical protein